MAHELDLNRILNDALAAVRARTSLQPEVGLVLGSGLGGYADLLEEPVAIPYCELPGFPVSTVMGHRSRFVLGKRFGKWVIAMQGRFHNYEGYTQRQISLPIRLMKRLGVQKLLVTGAAGGIREDLASGALVAIADHINYSGDNPLVGENLEEFGPRFPDMSDAYSAALRKKLLGCARENGIDLREGVYIMFKGPSYETPAEIRMARAMGADVVGMSVVPEAITANHCGMQVLGVACVTNMAAGVLPQALDHAEVMATAERVAGEFTRVVDHVLRDVF